MEVCWMNAFDSKRPPVGFVNFSETKRAILEDIRAKWGALSEDDLGRLVSNDDLVRQIAARYSIDKAQAQTEVDAVMRGRQI
jgi:hypothetical protein